MLDRNKSIDFFSASELSQRDTVRDISVSVPQTTTISQDTVVANPIRQVDFSSIDSILRRSEERERQIQLEAERQASIIRWRQRKIDTTEILYKQFGIANFPIKDNLDNDPFQQNVLYNLQVVKPEIKKAEQAVFIEEAQKESQNKFIKEIKKDTIIIPKLVPNRIQFDWITILLIVSFLLLGWIRLFNKKYLISLVKSIISFQESNTLYREKNTLMERASFMVNLLFLSNISVFVIQLRHYWNLNLNNIDDLILYFMVLGCLLVFYAFRAISSLFIGYVFLKQKVFAEYFHNVNIYTKNTGLFLFPVIITLQFLSFQYLPFIVYTGLILSAAFYLLQVIRSFQIIIRKNVSIFYMILYLCAFEFAPFLIIYKILLSLA